MDIIDGILRWNYVDESFRQIKLNINMNVVNNLIVKKQGCCYHDPDQLSKYHFKQFPDNFTIKQIIKC